MSQLITAQVRAMMAQVLAPNLTESITAKRGGVDLDPQNVMFGIPRQQAVSESEYISVGNVRLVVYGDSTLDLQPGDIFTRTADGMKYEVTQPMTIATNAVSRSTIVETRL
jgi:hypothetical protein